MQLTFINRLFGGKLEEPTLVSLLPLQGATELIQRLQSRRQHTKSLCLLEWLTDEIFEFREVPLQKAISGAQ